MKLEELQVYQLAMEMAEKIWNVVIFWNYFEKDTIGKQLIRAADSIAANLSEGFGRFFYKENKQFCYYFRGSLYETMTWLTKANNRNLINGSVYDGFCNDINAIGKKLNSYINSIGKQSSIDLMTKNNDK
jgi:four helix bundle protein